MLVDVEDRSQIVQIIRIMIFSKVKQPTLPGKSYRAASTVFILLM